MVLLLEPGIGELNRDPIQLPRGQLLQPVLQAHVGIAEQVAEMFKLQDLTVGFGGLHQRPPDLHAQVVALWFRLGKGEQETAAGAADVQVNRLLRLGEQLLGRGQLQGLLEEAAEGIDVLADHQAGSLLGAAAVDGSGCSRGTTNAQLAV